MTANVLPIPKKGDPSDPSNYRPIALRSILSKLFETLLNNQILSHFDSFQILQNTQYEFSKQISTTDLLISITNRFHQSVEHYCGLLSELFSYGLSVLYHIFWQQKRKI